MSAIDYASFYMRARGVLSALGDGVGVGDVGEVIVDHRYGSGTTTNNADGVFFDTRTLAASANEDLDLTTITDGNGDELQLKPSSSNGWTALLSGTSPVLHLPAGAAIAFQATADPALAVSGANKAINVANQDTAASATYTLLLFTRTA